MCWSRPSDVPCLSKTDADVNPGIWYQPTVGWPPKVLGLLTPTAIGPEGKTVDALAQRMKSESISRQRPQWLQACGSKANFPIATPQNWRAFIAWPIQVGLECPDPSWVWRFQSPSNFLVATTPSSWQHVDVKIVVGRCSASQIFSGFNNIQYSSKILSGKLTSLWKITIFNGKTHYKLPFSIAMLNYQRVPSTFLGKSINLGALALPLFPRRLARNLTVRGLHRSWLQTSQGSSRSEWWLERPHERRLGAMVGCWFKIWSLTASLHQGYTGLSQPVPTLRLMIRIVTGRELKDVEGSWGCYWLLVCWREAGVVGLRRCLGGLGGVVVRERYLHILFSQSLPLSLSLSPC